MAKKAKPKTTTSHPAYDDNDDSEDEFEEDTAETENIKGGEPNSISEGADPEPTPSIEQATHYLKNVGHWNQFLTTIKQYANAKVEQDKLTEYKFALKGEKPPA